jgi:hypothetical protein
VARRGSEPSTGERRHDLTSFKKLSPRSLGGLAGVVVAVAGGLGAAVGLYSLPLPQGAFVVHDAYAQATQRAFTASKLSQTGDGLYETLLRIEVSRGGRVETSSSLQASDFPRASGTQDVNIRLHAEVCTRPVGDEQGCETDQAWDGSVPAAAFQFSPLMDTAEFHGDAQECRFDIVWHPDGPIVPFEGHHQETNSGISPGPPFANAFFSGVAELSRIAPADIQMSGESCFSYARQGAPGYLTQGAGVPPTTRVGADTRGPDDL